MAFIAVNYAAVSGGSQGLVTTWNRIEALLAELDAKVLATADMTAETLIAYRALKARWDASAEHRQSVLHGLAALVGSAGDQYRQVDAAMAAQFG